MFNYKKKYIKLQKDIYLLLEGLKVQQGQFKWRLDFNNSNTENKYTAEEMIRLETLYKQTSSMIAELNTIIGKD